MTRTGQFYPGRGPANYLRLAYSHCSAESIAERVRPLGAAFRELTS